MNKRENIVYYADIGNVRYVNNSRAKNISIRINTRGEVRVTVPGRLNFRRAEGFLISKKQWIMGKLTELNQQSDSAPKLKAGDLIRVRGREIPVLLQKDEKSVEDALWRILMREGQSYLPGRVRELAATHGFQISGIRIRKMKTRWGSCTARNSINLNSWLMMLPDHLVDYVILHELVHTIHRNHSATFWEALDVITDGSSKRLRNELRKNPIMLIDPED